MNPGPPATVPFISKLTTEVVSRSMVNIGIININVPLEVRQSMSL